MISAQFSFATLQFALFSGMNFIKRLIISITGGPYRIQSVSYAYKSFSAVNSIQFYSPTCIYASIDFAFNWSPNFFNKHYCCT